ncbi:hypothetical protein ACQEV9_00935 [Streptomyces chartreusis]|uniref:hypothetical protein n=1 Tax=Streptomyces chartreusis TaxID=1969 RepID=UPI003D9368D7
MGVILWYGINFPTLGLKVSNDVSGGMILSDAEITVNYGLGQPGDFEVHLSALPLSAHRKLTGALTGERGTVGGIPIEITLGYLENPLSRKPVLVGRVDAITASKRFPPLGMRLTGYEEASFHLITVNVDKKSGKREPAHFSKEKCTPADAAKAIAEAAEVKLVGDVTPTGPEQPSISADAPHAFGLLERIADRYGAELLVQDGEAQFGTAVTHPQTSGLPTVPDLSALLSLIMREDSLVTLSTSTRLAEFQPVRIGATGKQRVTADPPAENPVPAFDFTALGVPGLRAGELVAASVEGYQNPLKGYRIIQLTHSFSPRTGYVCTGRAAPFKKGEGNRGTTETVRKGSPLAIADAIAAKIRDDHTITPSIDIGQIRSADPAGRVATVTYGQEPGKAVAAPSVDLPIEPNGPALYDKPLATPFAWHKVGLSVPVYAGMRTLLNQVHDDREDAVITGFLWANDAAMDRPAAQTGDWWLCLPTELSAGPDPRPINKGVNDLTTGDGHRVVEAIGLKISVGAGECSDVGHRPTPGPAEELLLSHSSGAQVRFDKDGNITLSAGPGKDVKVSASGGAISLSAGGATLTVEKGKVAIS